MKKIILIIFALVWLRVCNAQTKKDTVVLDSTQVEKIRKMPMDSTHEKMPTAPLSPKDTIMRKTGDDEDPKTLMSPK
jgi:hypothetical protein